MRACELPCPPAMSAHTAMPASTLGSRISGNCAVAICHGICMQSPVAFLIWSLKLESSSVILASASCFFLLSSLISSHDDASGCSGALC